MSAHLVADQTADGWVVTLDGGFEFATITTSKSGVQVSFSPDEDEGQGRPLDVALDQPKS